MPKAELPPVRTERAFSADTSPFAATAALARSLRALRRDASEVRRHVGVAAPAVGRIRAWIRSLPTLDLEPSDTAAGADLMDGLTIRQPWPARYRAVPVITLPSTMEAYLRGRSRQAVRTNRGRAQRRGISVVRPTDRGHAQALLATLLATHDFEPTVDELLHRHVGLGRTELHFAVDAEGVPVAMSAIVVDGAIAFLSSLQVGLTVEDRSAVRFLLSTESIRSLIDSGVRYLLAETMLLSAPGVVYLEQRLGFEPTNIRIPRARRRRHRSNRLTHLTADDPFDDLRATDYEPHARQQVDAGHW